MKNKSLKHWIVLICCCGIAASSIGACINTVGVFYTPVAESLNVLRGSVALQATFMTIAIALVSLLAPRLMHRVNFKVLLLIGALFAGGSTILMSMISSMVLFYILAIIKGIGSAIYNSLMITTILNNWFKEKIGIATSICLSFSGVAGAVLSPVLTSVINASGWRMGYVVLGIITFALVVPAIVYPFHLNPVDDNLLPYGATEEKKKVSGFMPESNFKATEFAFIAFMIMAILYTSITSLSAHLPGYATSIGISSSVGALMLSCTMVGNIGTKLLIGILADKLGAIKSVIVMTITTALAILMIMFIHADFALLAASVIFGSIYSIGAVGLSLLTKQFFGANNYTKAYSIVCFGTNMGAAFSATAIGYVYDFFGSYNYAFMIMLAFLVLNLVILAFVAKKKAN